LGYAFGSDRFADAQGGQKMFARNRPAQAARARIEDFGPMPTARQQVATLAVAGVAMIVISATMAYLGLI
jgi:hypothetical protein